MPKPKLRNIAALVFATLVPFAVAAESYEIMMLNSALDTIHEQSGAHTNVFAPDILRVSVGDTATFIATNTGHNTASKRGMLPKGAEPWNSTMDNNFTLTFTVPGIYGYVCLPHYEMGMVGLIIVANNLENLEDAMAVRQVGAAHAAFRGLFDRLLDRP